MALYQQNENFPIAVIGAGAGGLPFSVTMAEEGFDVILIEQGSEITEKTFNTDQYDYELNAPWDRGSDEWAGPVPLQRGIGLGGGTLYFQGLVESPSEGVLSNWGLKPSSIQKVYQEVLDFLKVAGEVQPYHPLNPVSQHLLQTAKGHGWKARQAPVQILSEPSGDRPGCNHCGLCVFGCRPRDKSSVNNTWLPRGKKTGKLTVLTESRVDEIELESPRRATALNITDKKTKYRLPVKAVAVAAGALETPYLLKASRQKYAPNGLGNRNVGRYLSGNIWHSLLVSVPKKFSGGHAGIPIDIIVEEFVEQGILLCQGRNTAGVLGPISAAKIASNLGVRNVRTWMRNNYQRLAGLAAYAESTVSYDDGLSASNSKSYYKKLRDADIHKLKKMRTLLRKWNSSSGATIHREFGSHEVPFTGAMFRGTCRLDHRADKSAVDQLGFLRGYENILVCDASVLGRGLIAHPSMVLQVLGVYFARHLATALK